MSGLRVTVTGATGLVGTRLLPALTDAGAQVTILTRNPPRAARGLGGLAVDAEVVAWDPQAGPAPPEALAGRDAVVNLAGENIAQRWSARARRAIRDSRVAGTRNLISGIELADPRPATLVNSSAVGYYGFHGEEPLDEDAPAGAGFVSGVCEEWEAEAERAAQLGLRVVRIRTGVVLDARGGALAKMLPPFRLGLGGPVAGGHQYISWVHGDDLVGMIRAAIEDERWRGAFNATAPQPATNKEFSRALGRVLKRPAVLPVPGIALRLAYGEMASVLLEGARVVPAKALVLGYRFEHPHLEEALRAALETG